MYIVCIYIYIYNVYRYKSNVYRCIYKQITRHILCTNLSKLFGALQGKIVEVNACNSSHTGQRAHQNAISTHATAHIQHTPTHKRRVVTQKFLWKKVVHIVRSCVSVCSLYWVEVCVGVVRKLVFENVIRSVWYTLTHRNIVQSMYICIGRFKIPQG